MGEEEAHWGLIAGQTSTPTLNRILVGFIAMTLLEVCVNMQGAAQSGGTTAWGTNCAR